MGFKELKHLLIRHIEIGDFEHEMRNNIDTKNLLAIGEVTTEELTHILKQSRGNEHTSSPHHYDSSVTVHIIKTSCSGESWYIKWYFDTPNTIFISIHH